MSTVTTAFNGQSKHLHILAGIVSLNNVNLAGKTPLLVRERLVNFGDSLPETSKNSSRSGMSGYVAVQWQSLYALADRTGTRV